jgi:hypothetical protein
LRFDLAKIAGHHKPLVSSHSLDEWVDVEKPGTVKGIQVFLSTIIAITGLDETPATD